MMQVSTNYFLLVCFSVVIAVHDQFLLRRRAARAELARFEPVRVCYEHSVHMTLMIRKCVDRPNKTSVSEGWMDKAFEGK